MDYKKTVQMLAHRLEQQKKVIEDSLEDNLTLNEALMLLGQLYQDHSGVLFGLKAAGVSCESECCGECCKKVPLPAEDEEDVEDEDGAMEIIESILSRIMEEEDDMDDDEEDLHIRKEVLSRIMKDKEKGKAEESEEMALEAYLRDSLTKHLSRLCPSIQIHEIKVSKKD